MTNKKEEKKENEPISFEVDVGYLRENNIKLFITAPMYGGMCYGQYAKSMIELASLLTKYGVQFEVFFLFNESLIQRGRNYCADAFLRSDSTHMIFVDSDITFSAQDVLVMLNLMAKDQDKYHIMAGAYPKKCITWEKITKAVNQGYADKDPNKLEDFVGDFVLNFSENKTFYMGQPVEVSEIGTGFMMISRQAFDIFKEAYPEMAYNPDHNRSEHFDGSRQIHAYFHCDFDEHNRLLSEDYYFCRKLNQAGGKIWLAPWVHLTHTGTYTFGGRLDAISALGNTQ